MPLDVPAHVQYAPSTDSHVQVVGGTNWDFSRSAQAAPAVLMTDPEPVMPPAAMAPAAPPVPAYQVKEGIPGTPAIYTLGFTPNSAAITKTHLRDLKDLPKDTPLMVIAYPQPGDTHAERVCKARARMVVSYLRLSGHKVSQIKSLGALAQTDTDVVHGQSVEILQLAPSGA